MIEGQDEVPLRGGRVTAGVVRVGETVRRPPTANSDFVKRLLGHLASKGFDGAPRVLLHGGAHLRFVRGVLGGAVWT